MKKLGLVGGTGPESTVIYYRELNRRINEKTGGKAFPEIAIESVDLCKALELVAGERYDELDSYLSEALTSLQAGGADIVALTACTMHIIFDRLAQKVTLPFISIPEAVAEYAASLGYKKVGLLGTIFTMEKDFMRNALERKGIKVAVPCAEQRFLVNERIAKELEYGIVKEESVSELISVIECMKKQDGIEAVILGCTELPLALNKSNCPVDCLDIMEIHIQRLTELITE